VAGVVTVAGEMSGLDGRAGAPTTSGLLLGVDCVSVPCADAPSEGAGEDGDENEDEDDLICADGAPRASVVELSSALSARTAACRASSAGEEGSASATRFAELITAASSRNFT
jgi:hypothetical protein